MRTLFRLALAVTFSCSKGAMRSEMAPAAPQYAQSKTAAAPAGGAAYDAPAPPPPPPAAEPKPTPDTPAQPSTPKQERMLHYNGYAKLSVDAPRKASDAAVDLAQANGGFVETLNAQMVTLRVPVDKFMVIYTQLLKLGDVIDKSVTAEDVTEAYGAIALRLQTAKTSRDRLIGLLAKAKTEREKLELLREIARLNLEIENLEGASRTLLSLARYSRITLQFETRRRGDFTPGDEPVAAFQWIHQLSPFRRDVAYAGKKLKMEVPKGLVLLDDKDHWITESADGCVYWASTRDNAPKGDAAFWRAAIKTRLGPEYGTADEHEMGPFATLRLVDRSAPNDAYRYVIGVRPNGDKLQMVEAYFPTPEHEKRYGEAIMASIAKGGS